MASGVPAEVPTGTTAGAERADSRRNRRQILDAASELLADSPGVTVAEVAVAAGVTRATFYRHFATRDRLLETLLAEAAAAAVGGLLEEMERLSVGDGLALLAHRAIELARSHRHLIAAAERRLEDLARAAVADEPLVGFLARRRAAGELRSPLPDEWLGTAVRVLCLAAASGPDPDPSGADRGEVLAATLRRLVE